MNDFAVTNEEERANARASTHRKKVQDSIRFIRVWHECYNPYLVENFELRDATGVFAKDNAINRLKRPTNIKNPLHVSSKNIVRMSLQGPRKLDRVAVVLPRVLATLAGKYPTIYEMDQIWHLRNDMADTYNHATIDKALYSGIQEPSYTDAIKEIAGA